jgi:cyclic pyranopterin phosphate synthase
VKINAVIIKNINDDELLDFLENFHSANINIRFIEYMPFNGNGWDDSKFMSWEEMKSVVELKYRIYQIESDSSLSKDFALAESKLKVSFISSISNHFCYTCNRLRITASGKIKNCLFSPAQEINLKQMLQDAVKSDDDIANAISGSLQNKWFHHPSADELINLHHNNMISIGG